MKKFKVFNVVMYREMARKYIRYRYDVIRRYESGD